MKVSYAIVRDGKVWYSGSYNTCHTDPQDVADALLALPLVQAYDEVRVWVGDAASGDPAAVARRDGAP